MSITVPTILVGYAVLKSEDIDYSMKSSTLIILCLNYFDKLNKFRYLTYPERTGGTVESQTFLSGEHKQNVLAHSLFNHT